MSLLPLTAVVPIFAPLVGMRVGLVHSPETGNAGDRLIERAAEQLLTRFGIDFRVIEPDAPGDVDVIALFGGGSYGHPRCVAETRRRAEALASGKPCVLLPQTAYGSEHCDNYAAAFVRDVTSLRFDFISGAALAPDLVMCWEPPAIPPPVHERGEFFSWLPESHHAGRGVNTWSFTDPLAYFTAVASCAVVVTNSLHAAICGLIAKREVTLCPTKLHKQQSVWETWLKHFGCKWAD